MEHFSHFSCTVQYHALVRELYVYIVHCPKNNLNRRIKIEPVMVAADATINVPAFVYIYTVRKVWADFAIEKL